MDEWFGCQTAAPCSYSIWALRNPPRSHRAVVLRISWAAHLVQREPSPLLHSRMAAGGMGHFGTR